MLKTWRIVMIGPLLRLSSILPVPAQAILKVLNFQLQLVLQLGQCEILGIDRGEGPQGRKMLFEAPEPAVHMP